VIFRKLLFWEYLFRSSLFSLSSFGDKKYATRPQSRLRIKYFLLLFKLYRSCEFIGQKGNRRSFCILNRIAELNCKFLYTYSKVEAKSANVLTGFAKCIYAALGRRCSTQCQVGTILATLLTTGKLN